MKKMILLLITITFAAPAIQAQTFAEWFQQNKTQKKYLLEQIAALQAYATVLKKGYDIAGKGLSAIGDIKNGDFNLHTDYFNSLKAVNPEVAKYPHAADIITIQQNIITLTSGSKTKARQSNQFTPAEMDYISGVYDRLNNDCLSTLNGLDAVTTAGKLEMKDDERIKRIEKLYAESQSQQRFAKQFSDDLLTLQIQKQQEKDALQSTKSFYNLQ